MCVGMVVGYEEGFILIVLFISVYVCGFINLNFVFINVFFFSIFTVKKPLFFLFLVSTVT